MQRLYKSCTRIPRFLWISDHCNLVLCRCNTLSAKFHNFLFTTYFPAYLMWHQANLVSIPLVPSSTSFIYITKCHDPAYINTMGDNSLSSLIVLLMGSFGGYVPPTCVWHLAVVRQGHREPSHWWSFTKAGPGPTTWGPTTVGSLYLQQSSSTFWAIVVLHLLARHHPSTCFPLSRFWDPAGQCSRKRGWLSLKLIYRKFNSQVQWEEKAETKREAWGSWWAALHLL